MRLARYEWVLDPANYGLDFVERMARLVGVPSHRLYSRWAFASWIFKSNGLERLLNMRKAATGDCLTWSEVSHVSALENYDERGLF